MYRRRGILVCAAIAMTAIVLGGCGSSPTASNSTSTSSKSAIPNPRRGTIFAIVCQSDPSCASGGEKASVTVHEPARLFSNGTVGVFFTYWCTKGDIIKAHVRQGVFSDNPYYYKTAGPESNEVQVSAKCWGSDHPIVDQALLFKPTSGSFGPAPPNKWIYAGFQIYSGSDLVGGGGADLDLSCASANECPSWAPPAGVSAS